MSVPRQAGGSPQAGAGELPLRPPFSQRGCVEGPCPWAITILPTRGLPGTSFPPNITLPLGKLRLRAAQQGTPSRLNHDGQWGRRGHHLLSADICQVRVQVTLAVGSFNSTVKVPIDLMGKPRLRQVRGMAKVTQRVSSRLGRWGAGVVWGTKGEARVPLLLPLTTKGRGKVLGARREGWGG